MERIPNIGAIVKTEDGEGEVDGVETLKERVRVKIKNEDGDGFIYKRYDAKDVKVIKDVENKNDDIEIEDEELKKLEEEV